MISSYPIVVTGASGFVGFHLCRQLLLRGSAVIGMSRGYHDQNPQVNDMKRMRLLELQSHSSYTHLDVDLNDRQELTTIFRMLNPTVIFHLAAPSHLAAQTQTHILENLLFAIQHNTNKIHIFFASSAALYEDKSSQKEDLISDCCRSEYAERKRLEEQTFNDFSDQYDIPVTALRLFSVYGPYGNPLMATFQFVNRIINKESVIIYSGSEERDWIYIDDAVNMMIRIAELRLHNPKPRFDIFNIGTGSSTSVDNMISEIETITRIKAIKRTSLHDSVRMKKTHANMQKTTNYSGLKSRFSLRSGLKETIAWHLSLIHTPEVFELLEAIRNIF